MTSNDELNEEKNLENCDVNANSEDKNDNLEGDIKPEEVSKEQVAEEQVNVENNPENSNQVDSEENLKSENEEEQKKEQQPIQEENNKEPESSEGNESKVEEKEADDNKTSEKSLVVKKEAKKKPEYVEEMVRKRKKKTLTFVLITLIIILIIAMSTAFAFMNMNSENIAKGIFIKNVDISGLSADEARKKIQDAITIELQSPVKLKYNDYEAEIEPSSIEYTYNIEKAVDEAYQVGRKGNIIQNNYELLFANFIKREIEIEATYKEDLLNKQIEDISLKIPGVVEAPSYYIEDEEHKLIIVSGKDGITVKKDDLKNIVLDNIHNRNAKDIINGKKEETAEIPVENKKADPIDIEKIYSEVKKDPVDAHYESEPFAIYPEVDGTDFDITIEEAKQIIAENKTEYEIPLKVIPASFTIYDIGLEAFPYELSTFSTRYDVTNYNRSNNLELAAEKINGTILLPGEVFSYNQVVGKRTIEAGFKSAAIYSNGKVEDGLGGGICQISSTLYNAVLLANLGIVERENHMFKTSYINVGRDATVVYGSIDFKFENTRNYPIRIEADVSNGVATMSIHGIEEEVEYEVEITPEITSVIPYGVERIEDPSLGPGEEVVVQGGTPGYRVTTYKELLLDGATVETEVLSNDTYSTMNRIVRVGVGGGSSDSSGESDYTPVEQDSGSETEEAVVEAAPVEQVPVPAEQEVSAE